MRDIVSGRIKKGRVGNRSERYLYGTNSKSNSMKGGRGRILLRLWKERTPIKIGASENRHIRIIQKGLEGLMAIEKELDVDFETMLNGIMDLYFSENITTFPSPNMFFSLSSSLAYSWYDERFIPELDMQDVSLMELDVADLISIAPSTKTT
mgnify:CR=1 FL=1